MRDESVNEWLYFLLIFDVKLFHDQIFGWITFFFIAKVVFDYCRKGLVDGFEILYFHLIKVYRNYQWTISTGLLFWNKKTMEWKGWKLFLYFLYPQWIGFCRGRRAKDQAIIFSFFKVIPVLFSELLLNFSVPFNLFVKYLACIGQQSLEVKKTNSLIHHCHKSVMCRNNKARAFRFKKSSCITALIITKC